MALDPMIARGVQPIEIGNTLMRIGALQQRDEALAQDAKYQNALMQDRQAERAQQQTALAEAQAQEQRKREAAYKYALIAKGDMGALQEAVAGISQHHPGFVEAFQRDPEQARAAILSGMQSEFGFAAPEKPPGPIQFKRTPWGGQYAEQDGQRVPGLEWNPPAPQQYAPTPEERNWNLRKRLSPEERAEFDRLYGPSGVAQKPIPTAALKIVDEADQAMATARDSKKLIDDAVAIVSPDPKTGRPKVNLGLMSNIGNEGRNIAGKSDEGSRAYATVKQTFEKLRSNYLLLAKGVQTEGDAGRAWDSEVGKYAQFDNALALQQLQRAQAMTERMIAAQEQRKATVYSNFGQEPPAAAQSADDPLGLRQK